jgi:hypothetical protein
MERKPAPFDRVAWVGASSRSHSYLRDLLERARRAEQDVDRQARLAKGFCVSCHYVIGRIGGAAMTSQPCACCLAPQMYASTNTDALCLPCAKEHSLCKHCGGDLDMRERRRNWPEPRK